MSGITSTTSTVKAIFSLDIITAIHALLLFILAAAIVLTRSSNTGGPLKTTLSTHLFLIPALFCLTISYAIQSAVVAIQASSDSPASITAAFSYTYADSTAANGERISVLTLTQQQAAILRA